MKQMASLEGKHKRTTYYFQVVTSGLVSKDLNMSGHNVNYHTRNVKEIQTAFVPYLLQETNKREHKWESLGAKAKDFFLFKEDIENYTKYTN